MYIAMPYMHNKVTRGKRNADVIVSGEGMTGKIFYDIPVIRHGHCLPPTLPLPPGLAKRDG
jgi:hypothetical protein